MSKSEEELMQQLANAKREAAKECIDLYFKEVIFPSFPNCKYTSFTDEYIKGVHLGIGGIVGLRPYNYILKGSKYYYNTRLKFIHYTSLKNCLNILREKSFRLYNLNSLDDKFELLFATNKLFPKFSVEEKSYWKGNIFTLSMCQFTTELKEKSFDIWRNYGQDGEGVGIVLSFNKENQQNWMNRYLSKIYYNSSNLDEVLERHNSFVNNNYFPILGDHQELLLNLSCFHKTSIYKSEKEVRYIEVENGFEKPNSNDMRLKLTMTDDVRMPLIFAVRDKDAWEKHKNYVEATKFDLDSEIDLGKNMKPVYFRRLYLRNEDRNREVQETVTCPHVTKYANDIFPEVRIEKIILGYRYNESKLEDIKTVVNEMSNRLLGYGIDVEISQLKKYF